MRGISIYKRHFKKPNSDGWNDLLNSENGKNDDDWLVTPPGSPFPSLAANGFLPTNCAPRSKVLGKVVLVSRPVSVGDKIQSMNTTNSEITLLRSRRNIASSSTSSTTTRSSTTPSSTTFDHASELEYWQSYFPSLSSDTPPNLRTSPFDRSPSCLQRSTPTSINEKKSYSKSSRLPIKSMTAETTTTMGFAKNASRTPPPSPASSGSINLGQINSGNQNMEIESKFKPLKSTNANIFSNNSSSGSRTSECNVLGLESDVSEYIKEREIEINPNKSSSINDDIGLDGTQTKEIVVEPQPRNFSMLDLVDATSVTNSNERTPNCTTCWKSFQTAEIGSGNEVVCQECAIKDDLFREWLMTENASHSSQILDDMNESISSNKLKNSPSFTADSNLRNHKNVFEGSLSTDANAPHTLNGLMSNSSSSSLDLGSSRQMVPHVESQLTTSLKDGVDSLPTYSSLKSDNSLLLSSGDHVNSLNTPQLIEDMDRSDWNDSNHHEETTILCGSVINEMVEKAVEVGLEKEQLENQGLNLKTSRSNNKSKSLFKKKKKISDVFRKLQNMVLSCTEM